MDNLSTDRNRPPDWMVSRNSNSRVYEKREWRHEVSLVRSVDVQSGIEGNWIQVESFAGTNNELGRKRRVVSHGVHLKVKEQVGHHDYCEYLSHSLKKRRVYERQSVVSRE